MQLNKKATLLFKDARINRSNVKERTGFGIREFNAILSSSKATKLAYQEISDVFGVDWEEQAESLEWFYSHTDELYRLLKYAISLSDLTYKDLSKQVFGKSHIVAATMQKEKTWAYFNIKEFKTALDILGYSLEDFYQKIEGRNETEEHSPLKLSDNYMMSFTNIKGHMIAITHIKTKHTPIIKWRETV